MIEEIVNKLEKIPTIEEVILRGSLAKGNWKEKWSDIDLVIVVSDTSNIVKVHKEISKIVNMSKIPIGVDIVYKIETPSLLGDLYKIGFKSIQSVLETIEFGKSYIGGKYLKKLKKERKILEEAITPKMNFLFIQDYLWYLRRKIRELDRGMNRYLIKEIVGLVFLICKRYVNLKKPLDLMPQPQDILDNMRDLYQNDITILEKLVKLREKSGEGFSRKEVKNLCYQGLEFVENIYYTCLERGVWKWGGQKKK